MASWNTYRFRSTADMLDFLNGAVVGLVNLSKGADVDNQTFVFDKGAGDVTVTFTPAKNRNWTLDEIVAQINATESGLATKKVIRSSGSPDTRLKIYKDLASLTIKGTGTANDELGFAAGSDTAVSTIVDTEIKSIDRVSGEQDTWVVTRYV